MVYWHWLFSFWYIIIKKKTISDYLDILDKLNLLNNQPAYSLNYRSPDRICKNIKRHFADPSLAALLNLNKDKLIGDLKTFGFLFKALVERDLNIYMII